MWSGLQQSHRARTRAAAISLVTLGVLGAGLGVAYAQHHAASPASSGGPAHSATGQPAPRDWICTMCPEIHSDSPGRCSKCGMDLVPAPASAQTPHEHPTAHTSPPPAHTPKPRADSVPAQAPEPAVQSSSNPSLSLDRIQALGVRTALVEETTSPEPIRATAVVSAPEQNVVEVHVRASGFVEAISVRETGIQVRAGQPLVSVYSPEVYQAQAELIATGAMSLLPNASRGDAARRKLELLGVSQGTADRVLASGKPLRTVTISAPAGGIITKKNVVLGAYVTPDRALYEIVDLSRVYITADVPIGDAARLRVGSAGKFAPSNREGGVESKVDLIYPQVNAEARTTRVRMQVQNKGLSLRPGEYGSVEFTAPARTALVIPRDAVVDTGERSWVFVEAEPGRFTPKVVRVGAEAGSGIEITSGLQKGEKVVSGAAFLLDSESRMHGAVAPAGN